MHHRQRPAAGRHLLAGCGDLRESHRVVHRIVLACATAAERDHRQPNRPHVHGADNSRLRRLRRHRHRCGWQVAIGRLEEIGGPAQLRHHRAEALGCGATVQGLLGRLARRGRIGVEAAQGEQLGAERDRHLAEALVARRTGQVVDGLPHLHGVARRPPEHPVHVGEERRGG